MVYKLWTNCLEYLGYCWPRKIWCFTRWLLVCLSFLISLPSVALFLILTLILNLIPNLYSVGAHACIIFFDVTCRMTYKNVPIWYRDVTRVCDRIPIVICGNKVDVKNRQVTPKNITFHRKKNIPYYDLSVRSNYNYEKPFIYLLRQLLKESMLVLIRQPALLPPEIQITREEMTQLESDFNIAANTPIVDNNEEEEFI